MNISCENCGYDISGDNISLKMNVAQCTNCNSIYRLDEIISQKEQEIVQYSKKSIDAQPKGVKISHNPNMLIISRDWFSSSMFFLLVFCIFWDGFMIAWYGVAITKGIWLMGFVGIFHLIIAFFITYYTICGFFNKTLIKATPGWLIIKHGPIPVTGNREIPIAEIDQLFCKKNRHQSKNSIRYSYSLELLKKTGEVINLLSSIEIYDQVRFIEQEIENFLGIEDRFVELEYNYKEE